MMDTFVLEELFDFSAAGDDDDHHHHHAFFSSSMNQDTSSTSSTDYSATHFHYSSSFITNTNSHTNTHDDDDFTDRFCVPIEDEVELEWLSKFVDDSFTDFPANNITGTINYQPENPSFHGRSRSKRTRPPSHNNSWTSSSAAIMVPTTTHIYGNNNNNKDATSSSSSETSSQNDVVVRRCTHCASEKTPQWRTGPLGPKTLCNACGVRYKSGRLVPEYRPAASPTFVLTQHSNSHRKVMELRRQKETMMAYGHQQLLSSEQQMYRHHGSNHGVC